MRFTKTIGVSNWKQFSVLQISTLFLKNGWLTRWSIDLLMRFAKVIGVTNWKQFSVLHIVISFLKMDDWPDGVSIYWWDSRKQLESRIENNSPYSMLWIYFGNGWLTRRSVDLWMRYSRIIGVPIWEQFSLLHKTIVYEEHWLFPRSGNTRAA